MSDRSVWGLLYWFHLTHMVVFRLLKLLAMRLTKAQKEVVAVLGRLGGQTRAKNLTPERRLEIARKASRAAARARTQKAAQSAKLSK